MSYWWQDFIIYLPLVMHLIYMLALNQEYNDKGIVLRNPLVFSLTLKIRQIYIVFTSSLKSSY